MSKSDLFAEDEPIFPDIKKKEDLYAAFVPSIFIMAGLPLKDVKKSFFTRKYNDISITLSNFAVDDDENKKKVPYGKYARLVLALLTTKAKLHSKESSVEIAYDSIQQLLDDLQLPKQRGKDVMEQLDLFLKSQFIFQGKVKKEIQGELFKEYESFDDPVKVEILNTGYVPFVTSVTTINTTTRDNKKNKSIRFVLSPQFVSLCDKHAVPINYTVYKEINSSVGKDIYVWLLYRNNFINDSEPLFLSKKALVDQFYPVSDPKDNIEFNNNYNYIKTLIKDIKENHYPELNVSMTDTGMILYKSESVIAPNDRRYILISQGVME